MSDMRKLLESMTKFAGEPAQRPGDQVRGTEQAKKKKSGDHPFQGRLVGEDNIFKELEKQLVEGEIERRLREEFEQFNEFAPDSNDGGEDDVLRNYARMWWAGNEATQMQIEAVLAKLGWEIGEDEGGYDNGGVFVVRAGDVNGNSYQSWAAEDLTEGVAEGWREESQDLEDWAKEVNKKLYKAHASQRPALAQQLSQLEHKHFGSPANPLTRIVKSALTALRNGQMSHYDSDKVGAMPFGSLVGDDAKEIAAANLHASENQGYSILKRNRIVDTVDDFLRLVDVVRTLPPEYLFKYKDAGGQAWFEIVKDIGWSKDDAPGQRYRVSQGVAEGTAQDSKSWMASVEQQYPGVRFVQAKMPGAPIIALVNGKPVAQFDTKQGVGEGIFGFGTKVPTKDKVEPADDFSAKLLDRRQKQQTQAPKEKVYRGPEEYRRAKEQGVAEEQVNEFGANNPPQPTAPGTMPTATRPAGQVAPVDPKDAAALKQSLMKLKTSVPGLDVTKATNTMAKADTGTQLNPMDQKVASTIAPQLANVMKNPQMASSLKMMIDKANQQEKAADAKPPGTV